MALYDAPIAYLDGTPADLHELRGQGRPRRERGLEVRPHPAVRGPRAAAGAATPTRASPCSASRATSSWARSRARPRRSPTFCSTTYGVTFPLAEKVEVNGDDRHPLYAELTAVADADGEAGDIQWNFEKFLVAPGGEVVARFRPTVEPEADELVAAIEATLPPDPGPRAGSIPSGMRCAHQGADACRYRWSADERPGAWHRSVG